MNVKVKELTPGDIVSIGQGALRIMQATFVAQQRHPIFPGLHLVVWVYPEGHTMIPGVKVTFDALSPEQEVGELVYPNASITERSNRLMQAMEFLNQRAVGG